MSAADAFDDDDDEFGDFTAADVAAAPSSSGERHADAEAVEVRARARV